MTSSEIRKRFLAFFEKRGHAVIPSASLITPDEKGVTNATLFNTAGMQPLVPYLLGKSHAKGTRLVDVQKCIRTVDIDDVGDKTHATFFEMLGNWSLGDYFKKEAIEWSYDFLTSKEEGLGLDPKRLYVSVFEGDANAPRDDEAADIWKTIFKKHNIDFGGDTSKGQSGRIFYLPAKNNWWEAGDNGPCGPDTEMFYDVNNKFQGKTLTHTEYVAADDVRDVIEVWNDVFMQYEKKDGKIIGKLPKPSVDTGAGLERMTMTMQGVDNIYDTDLFKPVMMLMKSPDVSIKSKRIIADHLRASLFLVADGVTPSNTDRGYILRRLIRRAIMNTSDKKLDEKRIGAAIDAFIEIYKDQYPEFSAKAEQVKQVIVEEAKKFDQTIEHAMNKFNEFLKNGKTIDGMDAFILSTSYGLPIEMTIELANQNKVLVDKRIREDFAIQMQKHQDLSRAGAEQKFKGGLGDTSEQSLKYHTATHLLHQALRMVLGTGVQQKGSNITPERLRFDFTHPTKMTDEEKKKVEDIVNTQIKAALPVNRVELPKAEAENTGALHFFGDKYGDTVSVYYIGKSLDTAFSKEFCGGPHVENTGTLGTFKIQKEEAVSAGVRRIKAILS